MTKKSLNLLEIEDVDDAPVSFTQEAIDAVKDAIFAEKSEPEVGLRVGVRGGGCAGYSYVLDFTKVKENDLVIKYDDFMVYVDPMSATHLEGTTIDYVTSLMGMGFKFRNPNAQKTCGCGQSFS